MRRPRTGSAKQSRRSRPVDKTEAGAGPRRCAIAGRIARPLDIEMLRGARSTDPHADLRAARVELLARQGPQCLGVVAATGVDDRAVERLVHDEMAEPARADDADAGVVWIALDRRADRLTQPIAAPRGRLGRREIRVEQYRHHRELG